MASITARRNLEKKAEELYKETHCKYYDHALLDFCFFKGNLLTSIARAIFETAPSIDLYQGCSDCLSQPLDMPVIKVVHF